MLKFLDKYIHTFIFGLIYIVLVPSQPFDGSAFMNILTSYRSNWVITDIKTLKKNRVKKNEPKKKDLISRVLMIYDLSISSTTSGHSMILSKEGFHPSSTSNNLPLPFWISSKTSSKLFFRPLSCS